MNASRFRKTKIATATLVTLAAFVYLANTSFLADPIGPGPILVAHKALGQGFDRAGLTGKTCTASRMIQSGHGYGS